MSTLPQDTQLDEAPVLPTESSGLEPGLTVIDGYIVNEDGEILGPYKGKPTFEVVDRESAEWVLKKIMNAELQAAAILAEPAANPIVLEAKTLEANARNRAREFSDKAEFYRKRYEAELGRWCKAALAETSSSSKTIKTAYGSVGTRTVPGKLAVKNEAAAIEIAKTLEWTETIVESFLISKLSNQAKEIISLALSDEELENEEMKKGREMVRAAFHVTPDTEAVDIKVQLPEPKKGKAGEPAE